MSKSPYGMQTRLIHLSGEGHGTPSVVSPIFQTSTFRLPSPERGMEIAAETMPTWYYTRYGAPNAREIEPLLAELAGAESALAVGSGMAAISLAVLSNVKAGDHVVAQKSLYSATVSLMTEQLPQRGVEVTLVDQTDVAAFEAAMRPNTRIVYTETPTNPTMVLTDLAATAAIARRHGALAITDNTFASSFNQHPLELGCDIVCESATKFMGGHSDVTAGVIMGSRKHIEACWDLSRMFGPVLHPMEAWLLRRGLQTFGIRMARHNENALTLARFLEAHPAVERVNYPGLASHPQHDLAVRQMPDGFGGILSFEVKGGRAAAREVVASTRLCIMAASLGGVHTLINHPATMIFGHQSEAEVLALGIAPGLLRLAVGLEDVKDLIADLDAALSPASGPRH